MGSGSKTAEPVSRSYLQYPILEQDIPVFFLFQTFRISAHSRAKLAQMKSAHIRAKLGQMKANIHLAAASSFSI
jgi:hypothetical protein